MALGLFGVVLVVIVVGVAGGSVGLTH